MNTSLYSRVSSRVVCGMGVVILSALAILASGAFEKLHAQEGSAPQARIESRVPYSVAIDGDYAVVGVQWHDGYRGAAYVLRRDGSQWRLEHQLSPDDLAQYDHFGGSVSILGDRIVVGAPWHDLLRGAAYVYTREGDRWKQTQKLTASDAAPESYFGAAVKVTGTELTVRTRASVRRTEAAAYRFGPSGNGWAELEKGDLPAADTGSFVVGGRAVAGAPGDAALQDEALTLVTLVERESGEFPPLAQPAALIAPSWVLATDGTLEQRVEVTWENTGQTAIAYKVLRDGTLLSLVSSDAASYHDETGTFGQTYSYCVVVTDMAADETAPVCDNGIRIIFAPHDVSASDGQYIDGVRITWVDMSSINNGYVIYRKDVPIDSVEANVGYYIDATAVADPDSVYTYGVAAYVSSGEQSAVVEDDGWRGVMLPPENLVASQGQYLDRVVLTWTCQATNELGYRIHRDGAPIDSTGVDSLSYTDMPVGVNQTHEYCVATIGPGGAESINICATGGTVLPPPGDVSASDSTFDDKVRITWTDNAGTESGYEISRSESIEPPPEPPTGHGKNVIRPYKQTDEGPIVLGTTRANMTVWDDFTAEPGVAYIYSVRAVCDSGGASASVSDSGSRSVVLAPYEMTATDGTFEDRVEISWKSTSTRTALFRIMRDGLFIKTVSGGDRSYRDYGGTAGQEYEYAVTAVTALGAEAVGPGAGGKRELLAPSGLTASDEDYEEKIVISWTDNSRIEQGYLVLRQDTASAVIDSLPPIGSNRTSYTDYTAVPGVTYMYSVAAFDSINGTLGYSAPDEDLGRRVLMAPTGVVADKGDSESEVEIRWRDNSDAEEGYRIYRDDAEIGTVEDNEISFVDTSPTFGQMHLYEVRAYDDYGESEADSDSGYTTLLAPVSFNASDVYEDRIEMTWIDRSGIENGVKIYRDDELIATLGPNVTTYTFGKFGFIGSYDTPGYAVDLTVAGNYAYVSDYDGGLQIINISNPASPTLAGVYAGSAISNVAVVGNYAYVTAYSGVGLRIVNVSNPASPTLAGSYSTPGNGEGIAVAGNYAYLACGTSGLQIINVSNPASPTLAGTYDTPDYAVDICVAGDYAYVADRNTGLMVINISNPATPTLAGTYDTPSEARGVDVVGNYAYVADHTSGLQIINISNPATPTLAGTYDTRGYSYNVAVAGKYAYVADLGGGLRILDVSAPASPRLVWTYDTYDEANGVAVAGGLACAAANRGGLRVFSTLSVEPGVAGHYCVRGYKGEVLSDGSCDDGVIGNGKREAKTTEMLLRLIASDGAADDGFGGSVAVSGDWAIVGAPGDDDKGSYSGSAYIFGLVNGTWTQKAKLTASDGATSDFFGMSVAISGDRAIVGATYKNISPSVTYVGAAYIFEYDGAAWSEKKKLMASDPAAGDHFGQSVSISGDRVIVGAIGKASMTGAAYIFEGSGTTWTQKAKIMASDGASGDYFGHSVSVSGDRVVVGARYDDAKGVYSGSAYVFELVGSVWTQKAKLTASDGAPQNAFGGSVSMDGDRAIVGSPANQTMGAAYVFERISGTWTETQKLTASDGEGYQNFGQSVSISGDRLVVGTQLESAYLFELMRGTWSQKQKLTADGGVKEFGYSVSISPNRMVVGAAQDSGKVANSGSAYVSDLTLAPTNVAASDGTLQSRVRVTWEDRSLNEKGYRIYRDGGPIATVNANVQGYEDFDAEPGRTYTYSVSVLTNDISNESEGTSDLGWRPANGSITGRVSTKSGAAADSIRIAVAPLQAKALLFDGNGGYISVPDTAGAFNFSSADSFTIEAWIKYPGSGGPGAGDGAVIAKASPGDSAIRFPFVLANMRSAGQAGRLRFSMSDSATTVTAATTRADINDGAWHHVACVHDASADSLRIYVDGVLEGDAAYAGLGDITNAEPLAFGTGPSAGSSFGGQLDEVRIWSIARGASQIRAAMATPLEGSETGLVAYWPLNDVNTNVITDLTSGAHYGTLEGGAYWTADCPELNIYPMTDLNGNYVLNGLYYGTEAEFEVRPFKGNRQFDPPVKRVVLNTQSPVENQANFVDISSFTVSGTIRYAGTACAAADIPVLVDSKPAGSTDTKGKFAVSVDLGEHWIRPSLAGHTFGPDSLFVNVRRDTTVNDPAGVAFYDSTTQTLAGRLGGGCGRPVGDIVITIRSENDCMLRTLPYASGDTAYSVSLPPQNYLVSASVDAQTIPDGLSKTDVVRYFQNLGARLAEMDSLDVEMDFVYRAPLQIAITGFEDFVETCPGPLTFENRTFPDSLPVIPQLTVLDLTFDVNENYGSGGLCPLDSGTVTVRDEFFDRRSDTVLVVTNGVAHYKTFASTPSLIVGRQDEQGNDRSFQKAISAVANVEGRTPVTATEWALITGHAAPEGADFVTATTELPLYILRDPPGDGSYAYLEQGRRIRTRLNWEKQMWKIGGGESVNVWWGLDQDFFVGIGAGFIQAIEAKIGFELKNLLGNISNTENYTDVTITTRERLSTSSDHFFLGEKGDVFVGAGLNFIFSEVGIIDVTECAVTRSTSIGFQPDSIETMYAYTQQYIKDVLIPQFDSQIAYFAANGRPDSAAAFESKRAEWVNLIALNDSLKSNAPTLLRNVSFSAGADLTYSEVVDSTWSYTRTNTFYWDSEDKLPLFEVETSWGGIGVDILAEFHHEGLAWSGDDSSTDSTHTTEVGYTLSDDNLGDHVTVNIKEDGRYPSPVFDVLAGLSSCPYEPWPGPDGQARTVPRDKPSLDVSPVRRDDVAPDEPAAFTLTLANLNLNEPRLYALRLLTTSNPYGAIVKVGGVPLSFGVEYFIDGGQSQQATLTVERGPTRYDYENIALILYPPCEYDILWRYGAPLWRADTVYVSVSFQAPCSDVTLLLPQSGWVYDKANEGAGDAIELLLTDYELRISEDDTLQGIGGEYRRLGSGSGGPTPWVSIPAESLGTTETIIAWHPPETLEDGAYELRAYTQCARGKGYSEVSTGTIERHGPMVLGTPQPSDGDLSFGEDISITFNEPIDCRAVYPDSLLLHPDRIRLTYLDGPNEGTVIPLEAVCNGTTIVITPTASAGDLEGRRIEASVAGVPDKAGNPMALAVAWTFDYRKSRFTWSELHLATDIPYRNPGAIAAELVNGTGQPVAFTIEPDSLPLWIESASPSAATIPASGKQTVSFALKNNLAMGAYSGEVAAVADDTTQGIAVFDLSMTVSCHEPAWVVDPSDFEHSMTMVAKLDIGGGISTDPNDMVAAFVGNQLRGVAALQEMPVGPDPYLAFLTIYSNRATGETVRFKIWDSDSCRLYNSTLESHAFVANGSIGSASAPVTLTADTATVGSDVLSIAASRGWTWISTNVRSADMSAGAVLGDLNLASGDLIKSQTAFSQFIEYSHPDSVPTWVPVLELDNVSGYMVNLSQAGMIQHAGTVVPVDTLIPVEQGWNWIGYLPTAAIDVTDALDDLDGRGLVAAGDIIKSQNAFAEYVNGAPGAWYGSLGVMEPGKGYRLRLSSAVDSFFAYPAPPYGSAPPQAVAATGEDTKAAGDPADKATAVENSPVWFVDPHDYQFNMTVTGVLSIEGRESIDERDMVGAFVGNECRGVASPIYIEGIRRYEVFLMVHSNEAAGERVSLRAFDADGAIYDVTETLTFEADKVQGTVKTPIVLTAGSVHEEGGSDLPKAFALGQNYPNPFNPMTVIGYDVPAGGGKVTLRIYDVCGRLVRTLRDDVETPGRKTVTWDGRNNNGQMAATGVYFYRMTAPGFEKALKMLIMR